jgi:hypothetical protein
MSIFGGKADLLTSPSKDFFNTLSHWQTFKVIVSNVRFPGGTSIPRVIFLPIGVAPIKPRSYQGCD